MWEETCIPRENPRTHKHANKNRHDQGLNANQLPVCYEATTQIRCLSMNGSFRNWRTSPTRSRDDTCRPHSQINGHEAFFSVHVCATKLIFLGHVSPTKDKFLLPRHNETLFLRPIKWQSNGLTPCVASEALQAFTGAKIITKTPRQPDLTWPFTQCIDEKQWQTLCFLLTLTKTQHQCYISTAVAHLIMFCFFEKLRKKKIRKTLIGKHLSSSTVIMNNHIWEPFKIIYVCQGCLLCSSYSTYSYTIRTTTLP